MSQVDQIANAVMYEGYNLYPYRPSAIKNRHRWTFGVLHPRSYCERHSAGNHWEMQTECLVVGRPGPILKANIRFLQLTAPATDSSWQEATPREVAISIRLQDPDRVETKTIHFAMISGLIELSSTRLSDDLFKITLKVRNMTSWSDGSCDDRDELLLRSLVSTHAILSVRDAAFVSLIDPPDALREAAAACQNIGAWPVLAGEHDSRQTMLASPIILYDYPQIAPESQGDLFDGTEIDEILSLRIQTLTDDEKREMATVDERTRRLLRRTQSMADEDLLDLHGTFRESPAHAMQPELQPGSRVRLRPTGRADAFDIMLNGKTATVVSIEQDYENIAYVTVAVDDDPGRDFGREGQIAHRFFFRLDEVEPVSGEVTS